MGLLYGSIILTYRCNAHCNMCNCFEYPSEPFEEITTEDLTKLPEMSFVNITGGEPFLRKDIDKVIDILLNKTQRVVISSNGYFSEKILEIFKKYKNRLGIRLSLEGLPAANDEIRGLQDGFDRCLRTLLRLKDMGIEDIGFGMTLQDSNINDLVDMYLLSDYLGMEFATAALHNSHYFRKTDNYIEKKRESAEALETLINKLLKSRSPKKWFRAYFNHGLINYIFGNKRLLPCEMGENGFFLDPWGDVLPCNGMNRKMSMGNLKEKAWEDIWNSERAEKVREAVRTCNKNCWMIGSAAPAMKQHITVPLRWVIKHKLKGKYSYRSYFGKK